MLQSVRMEVIHPCETSVTTDEITWCHKTEDHSQHFHCHEDPKSHKFFNGYVTLKIIYFTKELSSNLFVGGIIQQWRTGRHAKSQGWLHSQCTWTRISVRAEALNTIIEYYLIFITSVLIRPQSTY